jgi:predicted ribosomally synthesized peptide with SipW-like signal peptide
MTDKKKLSLSRRQALGGLGAIGLAGAGAGLGTSALFSDEESFVDNMIEAGTLDLVVDFYTSRDQGSFASDSQSGEVNGDGATEYTYNVVDLKPGDSGTLAFCPKIVDNPGWLWIGSENGVTDYENGQTEPEEDVDATTGGNLDNGTNDGAGAGELSDEIEVTVSYAESISYDSAADEITCNDTRELNNPDDYTLADLAKDLESGFPLDGDEPNGDDDFTAYPGSDGADDQQGPCICIEWEVPLDVGNEIQSDALELAFKFEAEQERNNPDPDNPFVDVTVGPSGGSTSYDFNSIQAAIDDSETSAGDVISVAPDTYTEDVTVDKDDLLLVSTGGPTGTTIDGQAIVSGNGAALCGFTVSPPPATSNPTGEALRVSNSPDDVVIMNNIVEDFEHDTSSGFGEDLSAINVFGGSSGDPIENVTVSNNTVQRIDGPSSSGSVGISIQGNVDGATVRNNTVSNVGEQESSYAFGIVVRGTDNHSKVPRNLDVIDNSISTILASASSSPYLGVGFGVEADGENYLFRDNTIDDVNIGVELKGAATELTLTGNSITNIDTSVNSAFNTSGIPALYVGDFTDNAPLATFIADNSYDVAVKSDGPFGPIDQYGTTYPQAIVPQ